MDIPLVVDDGGFVRAPESRVYPLLTHVAAWPTFWPLTVVETSGQDRFMVTGGRRWPRRLRLAVVAGRWRHDAGFTMTVGGDLVGRWEIWLEPVGGGTVVHHVLDARGSAAWQLGSFRRWVRAGLWGAKDHVEHQALAALNDRRRRPTGDPS